MTNLAREVEQVIERYQGQDRVGHYQNLQTTELLKKGPEEELDALQINMDHENLDRLYEENSLAESLEEAYQMGEDWERRATNYLLQKATIDQLEGLTLE
jgi:hypothetical protein